MKPRLAMLSPNNAIEGTVCKRRCRFHPALIADVGRLSARPRYTALLEPIVGGLVHLTAVFQKVAEGYIGFVEELPGANTQGATLDEARANLAEAVELVLETNRTLSEESILGQDVIREKMLFPAA